MKISAKIKFSPKFAQKFSKQLEIGQKSLRLQVGRIILKFLTSLAANINSFTQCSKFTITKHLTLENILKMYFKQKSPFSQHFLVNIKLSFKQKLKKLTRHKALKLYYKNILARYCYFKNIAPLVLYKLHFLDYAILYFLSYLCDFSQSITCIIFECNSFNSEVWKIFFTTKVNWFQPSEGVS